MKQKMRKTMAFLASLTMVITASTTIPYSNFKGSVAFAADEDGSASTVSDDEEPGGDPTDPTEPTEPEEGKDGDSQGNGDGDEEPDDDTNTAKVAGVSLSLSGKIGLNIYVENCTEGTQVKIDGAYATGASKTVSGKTYQVFTKEFAPKDYKNKVSVTVGEATAVDYSIADYVETSAKYLTDGDKELVKAMENYCKAADEYFNGDNKVTGGTAKTEEGETNGLTYCGASLILNSGIKVRQYFTKAENEDGNATTSYVYTDNDAAILGLMNVSVGNSRTVQDYITSANEKYNNNTALVALFTALGQYATAAESHNSSSIANTPTE